MSYALRGELYLKTAVFSSGGSVSSTDVTDKVGKYCVPSFFIITIYALTFTRCFPLAVSEPEYLAARQQNFISASQQVIINLPITYRSSGRLSVWDIIPLKETFFPSYFSHSAISTTTSIYLHAFHDANARASEAIANVLDFSKKETPPPDSDGRERKIQLIRTGYGQKVSSGQ